MELLTLRTFLKSLGFMAKLMSLIEFIENL